MGVSSPRALEGGESVIVFSLIIFLLSSYCISDGRLSLGWLVSWLVESWGNQFAEFFSVAISASILCFPGKRPGDLPAAHDCRVDNPLTMARKTKKAGSGGKSKTDKARYRKWYLLEKEKKGTISTAEIEELNEQKQFLEEYHEAQF